MKEAIMIAKEAIQSMPKNAKALTLIGLVLQNTSDGKEKVTANHVA